MNVLQLVPERRSFFDQQVRALEMQGVESTVVTVPGEHSPDAPRSVTDYLRYYPRVLRHVAGDYDLVHANYGLTAPFALAQPVRPVVLTLWGSDLMGDRGWLTQTSKACARLADATILPSRAMSEPLYGDYVLLPFAVDTDRFRPIPRSEARERLGWDPEATVALFPYDPNRPEKNYERAARVVERADADVDLRTVSDADYDEMPYYMNASDAVLVTSERESGPMVVKEAAACGVPVVSTDVGFVSTVAGATVCETDEELTGALSAAVTGETGAASDGGTPPADDELERLGERLLTLYEHVLDGGVYA